MQLIVVVIYYFKYLTEEFGSKSLELLKQKDTYPYEHMDSFKRFGEEKLSDEKCFYSSVKDGTTGENGKKLDGHISHEDYLACKKNSEWIEHEKYGWLSRSLFEKRCLLLAGVFESLLTCA